jgi:hypothetical protein
VDMQLVHQSESVSEVIFRIKRSNVELSGCPPTYASEIAPYYIPANIILVGEIRSISFPKHGRREIVQYDLGVR